MRSSYAPTMLAAAQMSCATGTAGAARPCRGEFRFDGVEARLRGDAVDTIVQFAELDPDIEAVAPRAPGQGLTIAGRGRHCDTFGRSFLASDMAEFRGLAYRPLAD